MTAAAAAGRLLAGALAAALAVACGAPDRNVSATGAAADSADQVMFGLTQFLTKNGVKQAFLQADTAFMYENSGRVDLVHLKVTFYSELGEPQSVLTGQKGAYFTRTNQMWARDSVLVVRLADQAHLRTPFLEYDPTKNEVRTDRPYVADKGTQHFEGVGFTCDPSFVNCSTQHAKGTAGQLVMPAR
ncbi:MAG TPA: LPS export ABC transporter periplasmic protein LptC [Gemmatimonadales bacterium]|nr:LPS export ABC transporter periplasmic protein LptC [Gemmatimonadales bacterium]